MSSVSADDEEPTQANGVNGDLEPGTLLHVDHKPRLLLMGLKRFQDAVVYVQFLCANYRPQEWEIIDIKRCLS